MVINGSKVSKGLLVNQWLGDGLVRSAEGEKNLNRGINFNSKQRPVLPEQPGTSRAELLTGQLRRRRSKKLRRLKKGLIVGIINHLL